MPDQDHTITRSAEVQVLLNERADSPWSDHDYVDCVRRNSTASAALLLPGNHVFVWIGVVAEHSVPLPTI